ncbi:SHUGOSHIN 2-like [Raphanus sativus]|uniref:SHUGOSHIN 2-like n=1 Tax=Raphanus sativus TaxID=3726 RepID=A0A9W3CSC0_RAPSA|nr:SHUGOSHIN 2-like [Raphanus sativus]
MLFSSKEYVEQFEKENMPLMKALAHINKIIELSRVEFQKLRINLRNVQEKNLQLARSSIQTETEYGFLELKFVFYFSLQELKSNRDRLKLLQHELGCKNVLLEPRALPLWRLPLDHHEVVAL